MSALPKPAIAQFGVGERFGVMPGRRDCPRCYRRGSLAGVFGGKHPIECEASNDGGCGALFWYEPAFADQPEALVRTSPPAPAPFAGPPEHVCRCGIKFIGWGERCDICRATWQAEQREYRRGP